MQNNELQKALESLGATGEQALKAIDDVNNVVLAKINQFAESNNISNLSKEDFEMIAKETWEDYFKALSPLAK